MIFDEYLQRWRLTPDGDPISTHSSRLLPVRRGDEPAMLKISHVDEERRGPYIMRWWDGVGAARVLEFDGDAVLLERATGTRSLNAVAKAGDDDGATRILCGAVAKLHEPRSAPLPDHLIPLTIWFRELAPAAERFGGILRLSDVIARELLAEPRDQVPLHGDIHHDNILDFGERGWLAIDPKGLYGERGFDYAQHLHQSGRQRPADRARLSPAAAGDHHGGGRDGARADASLDCGLVRTLRRMDPARRRGR